MRKNCKRDKTGICGRIQDHADDVLDIITGWCASEMRVWNDE